MNRAAGLEGGSRFKAYRFWSISLIMLAGISVWLGWNFHRDYQSALKNEYRVAEQGARHRATAMLSAIRTTQLMLTSIEEDLQQVDLATSGLSALLRQRGRQLTEVRAILVADAQGKIIGARNAKALGFDASRRDYFSAHKARSALGHKEEHLFYVSKLFTTINGFRLLTLSRALHDTQGHFSGVVLASIEPERFNRILASVPSEVDQESLLIHENGDVITSMLHREQLQGKDFLGDLAYAEHLASGQATSRHLHLSKHTGHKMLSVFHKVEGTPLIIIASVPYEAFLQVWQQGMTPHLLAFVAVAFFVLFLTWLLVRRQEQLHQGSQELQQLNGILEIQADKLHSMAFIDGLTKVANRRRFDEVLYAEWGRCQREQHDLSLMMIDIDFFKRYNDCYGHLKGDECLRRVASVLSDHLVRSADLVARFGGEEFACILPNTEFSGATAKAEELRGAVAALALPHQASEITQIITVSIGVATVLPQETNSPEMLLDQADQKLYQAKQAGRNNVKSIDHSSTKISSVV